MRLTQTRVLAVAVGLITASRLVGDNSLSRESQYKVATSNDVMVTMRDGVRLATDLYLPVQDGQATTGRFPVILTRTPYDKSGSRSAGQYFASRGYVFVAQDTRGRYHSDGIWHFLTDDGPDGVDTARWIEQQPWSDGQIGMLGTSYVGGTQHALALEQAPQLKTVIPVDAVSNMGYQSMRNAGAFELRFWNWVFANGAPKGSRQARDPATAAMLRQMMEDRKYYLLNLPLRRGTTPLQFAPEYEDWLVEAMAHGGNDEFWKQNNILDHPAQYKDIPVYLVGGWYDSWAGNTTANYQALSKTIHGPVYLIMGPWIHGAQGSSAHGQVSFGKDAAIPDELAWRLEWYDHWLKGVDNGVGKKAPFATPVRIFVMGTGDGHKTETGLLDHGGYWRDEQEWPLARTRYTKYYFQESGGLSTTPPEGKGSSTSFTVDPQKPVPTLGGNISSGDGIMRQGAWDQRGGSNFWNAPEPIPLSARNDILVFRSAPLPADLEVTGEIMVHLWASSSAVDTDFTAKLIDVYPPSTDYPGGFDLNLEDGIVRARFRESLKEEKLMTPGTIYPFTIKLYPTSNVFKKGHRIRVDISSSNFPRFDVNPNTGEPLNNNRRWARAVNSIYHESDHPSCIMLPVVPSAPQTTPATAAAQPGTLDLTRDAILDHIRGGWTGMLIGGIEGLAHEFKYIQEPRADLPEYSFLPNGARTDDDNDFEWSHLFFMDKENLIKIPYPRLVEIWKANMNTGLWCANLQARKLMDEGMIPPDTASPARNSFAPFNLAGQFCVEAYGMIAPGMPQTAADIGLHYASVSVSGEPLQATRYWTTLISLASVRKDPIETLLRESLAAVDPKSAQAEAVQEAIRLFHEHPHDWKAARQSFHEKWYWPKEKPWNPNARPPKWNDNSTPLNGAMVVLALLYGDGDFYRTGQYAMALGYDADCNAATACAVVGTCIGFSAMEKLPQYHMPDRYANLTRPQLPRECKVSEQSEVMLRLCEKLILANGGQAREVGGRPGYRIQLQSIGTRHGRWTG
jgi:uncharacterized protein